MKKIIFSVSLFFFLCVSFAQDATVRQMQEEAAKKIGDDSLRRQGWRTGGLVTLNLAQGALSNWQGGGEKSSFSAVAFVNLYALFARGRSIWDNTLDLGYGYLNTTTLGRRKSDDRIDLLSKYGYRIGQGKWYASGLFNFRTQFASGFTYGKDALGADTRTLTSRFLAPAYVLVSAGVEYRPNGNFSVFISPVTERWIIVNDDVLSSIGAYGVEPGRKSKNEVGAFLSVEVNADVMTNVTFKSRLDAFSNYKNRPANIDLFWTNVLAMKVNKLLSANIALDLLYDDDAIARTQVRQLLGIGFSAKF